MGSGCGGLNVTEDYTLTASQATDLNHGCCPSVYREKIQGKENLRILESYLVSTLLYINDASVRLASWVTTLVLVVRKYCI